MNSLRLMLGWITLCTFVLSSCVSTGGQGGVQGSTQAGGAQEVPLPRLDVAVLVFDPGLPEDLEENADAEELVWPELRRAEANRFAVKMKTALEQTEAFGAVRVVPDRTAVMDVIVQGTILTSNGAEVKIELEVRDISGRRWLKRKFSHDVPERFYDISRNQGQDPYDPVFTKAAQAIVKTLKRRDRAYRVRLQDISELRFASQFDEDAFAEHMEVRGEKVTLVSKPADSDPALKRIQNIRVRDRLFLDEMQPYYQGFSGAMEDSYGVWQEESMKQVLVHRAAQREALTAALGGVLLIGLAAVAAVVGGNSSSPGADVASTTAQVGGVLVGAQLLQQSFQLREDVKVHRETLNELGRSIDIDMAPRVVKHEEETLELTGDVKAQYAHWRAFLKRIHAAEATPDVQL